MAEVVAFKLEIDGVEQTINSVADLKKAISDLQKAAENADLGSENQKQLIEQLDVLQGKMRQATTSQENLAKAAHEANLETNDLRKQFEKLENELFLMAGQGKQNTKEFRNLTIEAAALNKKIDAVNQSLGENSAGRASAGFSQLSDGLKNLDFDSVKKGLAVMKTALAATGVMLLVQGVMYLIENFDSLSKGSGILGQSLRAVGEVISWVKNAVTDLVGVTDDGTRALEKQGEAIKKSSDTATEKLTAQTAAYDRQIAAIKASGKSTVEIEKAKQQAIIDTNLAIANQIKAFVEAGGVFDEEKQKLLTASLEAIKNAKVQEYVIEETDHKAKVEQFKKNAEALAKAKEDQLKVEEAASKELEKIKEEIAKQKEIEAKAKEQLKQKEELDLAAQRLKLLGDMQQQEIAMEQAKAAEMDMIAKASAQQKIDIQMAELNAASQIIGIVGQLASKNKDVQKAGVIADSAVGIAKMIIANKAANVAALATPQAIATSGASAVPVIAMNNVTTGLGIAASIIATNKALQSLGGGSTSAPSVGGGGFSAAGGSSAVPNVTPPSTQPSTLLDANGQPINSNKPQTFRVINVESDTTRVQEDVKRVRNQATI